MNDRMKIDQYFQNDKLYQLEVETQTIKEKLKSQQNIIYSNN
jgi:hypothetical protein